MLKRTTARKFYMIFPTSSPEESRNFGTLVFFDDLRHCGIVKDVSGFYHALSRKGTIQSRFAVFWRRKVVGYRRLPIPGP